MRLNVEIAMFYSHLLCIYFVFWSWSRTLSKDWTLKRLGMNYFKIFVCILAAVKLITFYHIWQPFKGHLSIVVGSAPESLKYLYKMSPHYPDMCNYLRHEVNSSFAAEKHLRKIGAVMNKPLLCAIDRYRHCWWHPEEVR